MDQLIWSLLCCCAPLVLGLGIIAIPVVVYLRARPRRPSPEGPRAEEEATPIPSPQDYLLHEIEAWRKEQLITDRLYKKLLHRYQLEVRPGSDEARLPGWQRREVTAVELAPPPVQVAPTRPPVSQAMGVPFIEWLLSPRNIKIALYSGAVLLVLAGIAFVASRWGEFIGPVKLAIVALTTSLLYLSGYSLCQRHRLQLGGIAVLGVASGFLPLNFAVLQIYVLGPGGFRGDVMWLIASLLCLATYVLTACWTRASLFSYGSIGAVVSALAAGLAVGAAPLEAYPLAYLLLAQTLLILGHVLQGTWLAGFTRVPLLVATQVAAPLLILVTVVDFAFGREPWLAVAAMYVGVLFYATTDALLGWRVARWASAMLLPVAFALTLAQLQFSPTALGIAQMLLAIGYLVVGYCLERLLGRRADGWPLYTVAYVLAMWVTFQAIGDVPDLIKALFGDVAILGLSAYIHRRYAWVYGAVWLLMLPIYLFLDQHVSNPPERGLLMGGLGMAYLLVGYALSRREVSSSTLPWRGAPFLTAAAFLSVLVVVLAWISPGMVTMLLAVIALLYLGVALWLVRPLLLFPALTAVNVAVFTTQEVFQGYGVVNLRVLVIGYAALTLVLLLGGLGLRRVGRGQWVVSLYVIGALDMAGSYGAALLDSPMAIALSAIYATLLLAYSWLERPIIKLVGLEKVPVLTYSGLGVIGIGHFYLLESIVIGGVSLLRHWPVYTAALCGLFVMVSWWLRRGDMAMVYGTPLRRWGLGLTLLPMAGALYSQPPLSVAVAFVVVGLTYGSDALVRRAIHLAYLSGVAFQIAFWAVLVHLGVDESQAYVFPLGLGLLGVGWNERRRGGNLTYHFPTLLGLGMGLGLSLVQSLPSSGFVYAVWLGAESLAAFGWGVWTRSRAYVILGALALITDGVTQFRPAFVELERWVQLAVTGGILLGGGLLFLAKREKLLKAWRTFSEEWPERRPEGFGTLVLLLTLVLILLGMASVALPAVLGAIR